MPPAELDEAALRAVRDADEQGLRVRAERHARQLPEDVDLLLPRVAGAHVVHVDEVRSLRRRQEAAVRREPEAPDGADPPLEHRQGPREVADVPQPAGGVLVPGGEDAPVGVPRRRERVVQVPLEARDFLQTPHDRLMLPRHLVGGSKFQIASMTTIQVPCQTEDQLSDSQNYRQEQRQTCHQDSLMCPVVDTKLQVLQWNKTELQTTRGRHEY